jgi:hypothetical protein
MKRKRAGSDWAAVVYCVAVEGIGLVFFPACIADSLIKQNVITEHRK